MSSGRPERRIGWNGEGALHHVHRLVGGLRVHPERLPKIGVAIPPGQMQLTRTPLSPSSMATDRVSWITAAFAAEYTWGP